MSMDAILGEEEGEEKDGERKGGWNEDYKLTLE